MKKNTAGQKFHAIAFNENGRVTGDAVNITCELAIDDGARAALSDVNPTEIGTTGEYVFDLTQAETNGHKQSFTPVSATAGVQVLGVPSNVIYTTVGDGSIVVLPSASSIADRDADNSTIVTYTGESVSTSVSVFASDGTTAVDLTGETLVVVFEEEDETDIATVTSGSITIGGADSNVVSFAMPAAVTNRVRVAKYAIRRAAGDKYVFDRGNVNVRYAPETD